MQKLNIRMLIFSLLIPFIAGYLGSSVTYPSIPTWYQALNKPSFNPPNWLFGPVWSLLYLLMGISFYLIVRDGMTRKKREAVIIFFSQLVLNTLWSIVFFGFQSPFFAFIVIVLLWFLILKNILAFKKFNKKASYLLIPYLLWVSFALVLNLSIYILNR